MTDKPWQITGNNDAALFTLKLHRGEGMLLIAMNWKGGTPPPEFVGFAIEYQPPGAKIWWRLKNRLAFPGRGKAVKPGQAAEQYSTMEAPLQTFRWVHFPRVADTPGRFAYRATPLFMYTAGELAPGEPQQAEIELYAESIRGRINIAFTRGYVSSQGFVEKFGDDGAIGGLLPAKADEGLDFVPASPKAKAAYDWMGFEARERILDLLDRAIADDAEVMVACYDLNLPEIVDRLATVGAKLRIIIDDSVQRSTNKTTGVVTIKGHGAPGSAETQAAARLTAVGAEVVRQHMVSLQHNKMIIVDGPQVKAVVLGSTNLSWRGFFVQSNNAVIVLGARVVAQQREAFDAYFTAPERGGPTAFAKSPAAQWRPIEIDDVDGDITMSPHAPAHVAQPGIADAIDGAEGSLFYSLAFLNKTAGDVHDAVERATRRDDLFVYGISDQRTGFTLLQPGGNPAPVYAASLGKGLPEPFRGEATGGFGIRMHHKFVVIDFDRPTARVYTGSYNFSDPADTKNGENLIVLRSGAIATAYMVEALRIFDAFQFRISVAAAKDKGGKKELKLPPKAGEDAWWAKFWTDPVRIRDRELFA